MLQTSHLRTPDILACVNGLFVALELKSTKGKPTELQLHKIDKILGAGGIARIVYPFEWDDVFQNLKQLAGCNK